MVDPFAPPNDTPAYDSFGRPNRPATTYSPSGTVVETYPPPLSEPAHERRFRRTHDRGVVAEPAHAGVFWVVAAVGVGLLCFARLVLYFATANGLTGSQATAALFGVLGLIAVAMGMALAAVLQRGLGTPVRTALMIGAGYFATIGGTVLSGFRLF